MQEYKDKLHDALCEVAEGPVNMRTIEQASSIANLLKTLDIVEAKRKTEKEFDRAETMYWAEHMQNADGTTGPHWTMDQTSAVADASGAGRDIPHWIFGVTMNMMYSDYYEVARKFGVNVPEFYAELARAFLMDKDGPEPEEKLCAYYRCIVKQNR
jgi:hypothetical protein